MSHLKCCDRHLFHFFKHNIMHMYFYIRCYQETSLLISWKSCKLNMEKRNCEIPKHDFLEK